MTKTSPIQVKSRKKVAHKDVVSRINYANFVNKPLKVVLYNINNKQDVTLQAFSEPFNGDSLVLKWVNPPDIDISKYQCKTVLLNDFDNFFSLELKKCEITDSGITIYMPFIAHALANRKALRVNSHDVKGTIIQNGTVYKGMLENFNTFGFLISIENSIDAEHFYTSDSNYVIFNKNGREIYSGDCCIYMIRERADIKECVVIPKQRNTSKYRKKIYRGDRYTPGYPLKLSFNHPVSDGFRQLNVLNISGSGFAVEESIDTATLFPGLIISEIELTMPGGGSIPCCAQVIYSREEKNSNKIISGLAIIDMRPEDYSKLINLIHNGHDPKENVCNKIDIDSLWGFFFESGFIYPKKYKYIYKRKEKIKKIFRKLYSKNVSIFKYFVYQKEEKILGHMSMLRAYEKSWLLHHHASSKLKGLISGINVLNQVGSFTNNCHRLEQMNMEYLICYYRPQNRFPDRIFGGLAENIGDREKCSLDDWHYYHFDKSCKVSTLGPESVSIKESSGKDISQFAERYNNCGGLMLKALGIDSQNCNEKTLIADYDKAGFIREIQYYSIIKDDVSVAIVMVDRSEPGLNMSDLTNSFKIFVIQPDQLNPHIVNHTLSTLSYYFPEETEIPVLINNCNKALDLEFPIEKTYRLWCLNMDFTDSYFQYMERSLRHIRH